MCGNHEDFFRSIKPYLGSPPRVREPLHIARICNAGRRITPACAGTTFILLARALPVQDHPRVCGNHEVRGRPYPQLLGSPPRVREPLFMMQTHIRFHGITPACAGTTCIITSEGRDFEDHPRVCGNHTFLSLTAPRSRGSPPRVREPPLTIADTIRQARITPACAGTTKYGAVSHIYCEDHPRVCGNHQG